MKTTSRILIYVAIATLLSVSVGCLHGHAQNTSTVPPKTSLQEIHDIPWEWTIVKIQSEYPGGRLIRSQPERETLSFYSVPVIFKDLKSNAQLHFNQNEAYVRGLTNKNVSLRRIVIETESSGLQEEKFTQICSLIKKLGKRVFTTTYTTPSPQHSDAEFSVDPLTRSQYPHYKVDKNARTQNRLEITITLHGKAEEESPNKTN